MSVKRHGEGGLKAIIAWKFARAAGSALLAVVLGVLTAVGVSAAVDQFAANVHEHAAHRISLEVSALALRALEPNHVWIAVGGLVLDAAVVFLEGWALHKRWWWGPWLVVAATASLVPFEGVALAHHASLPRLVLLAVNLLIVGYLLVRTWREHRARLTRPAGP